MPSTSNSNLKGVNEQQGESFLATTAVFYGTFIALAIGQVFALAVEVLIYTITFGQDLAAALYLAAPRVSSARYPNLFSLFPRFFSGISPLVAKGVRYLGIGSVLILLAFYWHATCTPTTIHLLPAEESKIHLLTSFTAILFGLVGLPFINNTLFAIIMCLLQSGLRLVSQCSSRLLHSSLTKPPPPPQRTVENRKHRRRRPTNKPSAIPLPDVPLPPVEFHKPAQYTSSFYEVHAPTRLNNSPIKFVRDPYPPASASFFRAPLCKPPNSNGYRRAYASGPNVWVPFTPPTPTRTPVSTTPTPPPPYHLWREHGEPEPTTPDTPSLTSSSAQLTASPPLHRMLWTAKPEPADQIPRRRDVGVQPPAPASVADAPQPPVPTPHPDENLHYHSNLPPCHLQPSEQPQPHVPIEQPAVYRAFGLDSFFLPAIEQFIPAFSIPPACPERYVQRPATVVPNAPLPQGPLFRGLAQFEPQSAPGAFVQESAPPPVSSVAQHNSTAGGWNPSADYRPHPAAVPTLPRGGTSPTDRSGWTGFCDVGSSAKKEKVQARGKAMAKEMVLGRGDKVQAAANRQRFNAINTGRGARGNHSTDHSRMDTTEDLLLKAFDLSSVKEAIDDIAAGVAGSSNLSSTSAPANHEDAMDVDWIRKIRAREDDDGDDERIKPNVPQPLSGPKRNVRPRQGRHTGLRRPVTRRDPPTRVPPRQAGPTAPPALPRRNERVAGHDVVTPAPVGPTDTPAPAPARPAAGPSTRPISVSRANTTSGDVPDTDVVTALDSDILMDGC